MSGRGGPNSYSDEHSLSMSAPLVCVSLCGHDPDRQHAHSSLATLAFEKFALLSLSLPDSGRESMD